MQGNMLDKYAFGAHAIMLVYDVTNGASFDQLAGNNTFFYILITMSLNKHLIWVFSNNIQKIFFEILYDYLSDWLRSVKSITPTLHGESPSTQGATGGPSPSNTTQEIRPIFALVANKIDQEHLRVIKSERHHKFAQVSD